MTRWRCPGQDLRYWKPEDLSLARCPGCGQEIEIWKDEPARPCSSCGRSVVNPKLDLACLQWCEHARDCPAAAERPPDEGS